MLIIPQVKPQYSVLRLLLPLEKLPGLGVRLLMIITNALFFKSNEGAGINNIPQSSGHFFVPIIILNQIFTLMLSSIFLICFPTVILEYFNIKV